MHPPYKDQSPEDQRQHRAIVRRQRAQLGLPPIATRLPNVTDPTANGARDPIAAEVVLHNERGDEYLMRVLCGFPGDVVPAAERAVEHFQLDLGVSDWSAA
jgi:hypothetical protein